MCVCLKCVCSNLIWEGTLSPVCSFWTSTKYHFLSFHPALSPGFSINVNVKVNRKWVENSLKNIQFAFTCILLNHYLMSLYLTDTDSTSPVFFFVCFFCHFLHRYMMYLALIQLVMTNVQCVSYWVILWWQFLELEQIIYFYKAPWDNNIFIP